MATPRRGSAHFLVIVLVAFIPHHRAAAHPRPVAVGEAELLLEIKRAWGDPPVLAAWNASSSAAGAHCRWPYVRCDSAGRVTRLALTNTNVAGPIPNAIGNLSSLVHLNLFNNSIFGVFPTVLYRCRSLRYLNLTLNHLGGELPNDIGHGFTTNMSTLSLSANYFNGSIPVSLSMLRNLHHLALGLNGFTGTIPVELGKLTSLHTLWLGDNPLAPSELPMSFKNLTNLVSLWVANCSLVGNFPNYIMVKMPKLESLCLSRNSLTGSIPPGIWRLENLQYLMVDYNNFTGDVVVDGFAAMNLILINLAGNNLSVPEVFGLAKPRGFVPLQQQLL
nr:unnamed protein product [Digitaria exilis]